MLHLSSNSSSGGSRHILDFPSGLVPGRGTASLAGTLCSRGGSRRRDTHSHRLLFALLLLLLLPLGLLVGGHHPVELTIINKAGAFKQIAEQVPQVPASTHTEGEYKREVQLLLQPCKSETKKHLRVIRFRLEVQLAAVLEEGFEFWREASAQVSRHGLLLFVQDALVLLLLREGVQALPGQRAAQEVQ